MLLMAHAKINWALNVTGRRADGYHLLDMLIQRLELADELTLTRADSLTLRVQNQPGLPGDERNLVFRAAQALKAYTGYCGGARLSLTKHIPLQAGLGGGSADAAACLLGLNELWGTGLRLPELSRIAETLGADVPLCLAPGLARAQGIGEQVTPLPGAPSLPLLILQPGHGLATAEVFSRFATAQKSPAADLEQAQTALLAGSLKGIRDSCRNQLQAAATAMLPEIGEAVDSLVKQGAAFAQMSGSGSAVFGVFDSEQAAQAAHRALRPRWPVCLLTRSLRG